MRSRIAGFFLVSCLSSACAADRAADDSVRPISSIDPLLPAACGAGTRPTAEGACAPTGTTSVPPGFAAAANGWGFTATLPRAACTGATIASLGSTTCEPIDDCSAPFPPADATVVVSANGASYAGREALTVMSSLAEAMGRVGAGVIAVDTGTFELPDSITAPVRVIGRCAAKTTLHGRDIGVRVQAAIKTSFTSVSFTGATKVAFLVDKRGTVTLDRVYVHADSNGAVNVGNGALLEATRSVFEGPVSARNPNASTSGILAAYGGRAVLGGVEIRHVQSALIVESQGSTITATGSVMHDQVQLQTEAEALAMVGAFTGGVLRLDGSHVESSAGRVGMVGAALLNGEADPTSPGNPPASVFVSNSTLVQGGAPLETGSTVDCVDGASLSLDNVSVQHMTFGGISGGDGARIDARNVVVQADETTQNARTAFSLLGRSTLTLDGAAIIGASQGAILLNEGSTATITGSLVANQHAFEEVHFRQFMGNSQAIAVSPESHVNLSDSALVGNEGTALFVDQGTADLDRVVILDTKVPVTMSDSAAIVGVDSVVTVRRSLLARNALAFAFVRGRGVLSDSVISDQPEVVRLDGIRWESSNADDVGVDGQFVSSRNTFSRNAVLVSEQPIDDR